jgi:hypothetical protein
MVVAALVSWKATGFHDVSLPAEDGEEYGYDAMDGFSEDAAFSRGGVPSNTKSLSYHNRNQANTRLF